MFNNLGSGEIVIVVLVLIFLFGGKKLPEIARGLGESSKEIKKVKKELERTLSDVKDGNVIEDNVSTENNSKGGDTSSA